MAATVGMSLAIEIAIYLASDIAVDIAIDIAVEIANDLTIVFAIENAIDFAFDMTTLDFSGRIFPIEGGSGRGVDKLDPICAAGRNLLSVDQAGALHPCYHLRALAAVDA